SVFDIHERGIAAGAERALKEVDRDRIYLTVDMDGIDPSYAPAVGNPEPFGLSPLQVKKLIGILAPHLVGMDLNEVSPAWDFGQTALLAARLIREAIVAIDEARGRDLYNRFVKTGQRKRRAPDAREAAGPDPSPSTGVSSACESRPPMPHRKAAQEQRHRSSSQPVTDDGRVEHILFQFPRGRKKVYVGS